MNATNPGIRERIGYQAILLGGFTILATALLIGGDIVTREPIAQRRSEDMKASISQVVLPELYDNNLLKNRIRLTYKDKPIYVYRGTRNRKVTALAYPVSEYGYGGEIVLMMGVDTSGTILGVRVLSHSETPGLGDRIEVKKTNWIKSFNGLSFAKLARNLWGVKKDGGHFDQFSGATITPRAVVRAVKSGLDFFAKNKAKLIQYEPDEQSPVKTSAGAANK